MKIYSQIHKISIDNQDNNLYKDLSLVQKLIDQVNSELKNQLKNLEAKYQQYLESQGEKNLLEKLANDSDDISSMAAINILEKNSNEDFEDEIRESMINDNVLFYFSKYQKYQKYQNEVNTLISDQDFKSGVSLEQNQATS